MKKLNEKEAALIGLLDLLLELNPSITKCRKHVWALQIAFDLHKEKENSYYKSMSEKLNKKMGIDCDE